MVVLIRPTRAGAQVPATAHGLLAAVVSLLLGITAHSLGGGHLPTALQVAVVAGLATCVGLVRAAQLRTVERSRARGRMRTSAIGTVAAVVGGQAGAHLVLALLDGHGMHGALAAGPVMLAWHVLAIPAAIAVLLVAERLHRVCGDRLAWVWRLVTMTVDVDAAPSLPVDRRPLAEWRPSPMVAAAGVRGPPLQV